MADTLTEEELRTAVDELNGWTGDTSALHKRYEFDDFTAAMGFVAQVALVAQRLNHHPDINVSWATVDLTITSHAAGGVTARCVELAQLVDARAT